MANLNRHNYSQQELINLQDICDKESLEISSAQKELGKLKSSKSKLQQQHQEHAHKYR